MDIFVNSMLFQFNNYLDAALQIKIHIIALTLLIKCMLFIMPRKHIQILVDF